MCIQVAARYNNSVITHDTYTLDNVVNKLIMPQSVTTFTPVDSILIFIFILFFLKWALMLKVKEIPFKH